MIQKKKGGGGGENSPISPPLDPCLFPHVFALGKCLKLTLNVVTRKKKSISCSIFLSNGGSWEVNNNGKFQTFSSKSGRGRLREVLANKRFQI